jgi:hypothetical protein
MNLPIVDKRMLRLIVGLALENELYNNRENPQLRRLYSDPNRREIQNYYLLLVSSESSDDREVAFWLENALVPERLASPDTSTLAARLQQLETILYALLIENASATNQDLNDWLNYVANAGESLRGNYLLDAKIFTSRAVESSQKALATMGIRDPLRHYELGLLRAETQKVFEELKKVHSTLQVPEELLDSLLNVESSLVELLSLLEGADAETQDSPEIRYAAQRLASAQRLLLRSQKEVLKAKEDLMLAQEYITKGIEKAADAHTRKRLIKTQELLRTLALERNSQPKEEV